LIYDERYEGVYIFLGGVIVYETNMLKISHRQYVTASKIRKLAEIQKSIELLRSRGILF
jgi:hypothetical protein